MKQRVTVIGANGFIGQKLSQSLSNSGYAVTGISRSRPKSIEFHSFHEGYNYELSNFESVLEQADVVIFAAGKLRPSSPFDLDAIFFEAKNILSIAEKCARNNVKKFIMTSSGGTIYGNPKQLPIPEDTLKQPHNPYGYMHSVVEDGLSLINSKNDMQIISLRIGNAYGPGQTSRLGQGLVPTIFNLIRQNKTISVYGDGTSKRDYVYIDDITSFFKACLEQAPRFFSYNVSSGIGFSILDVIDMTQEVIEEKINFEFVDSLKGALTNDIILDASRAKTDFNWVAETNFKAGIKNYDKWLNSQS